MKRWGTLGRKLACLGVLLALSILLAQPAGAVGTRQIRLEEVDITLELPSDMIVLTRDMEEDDPNLDIMGQTKAEVLAELEAEDGYLEAWDLDGQCSVYVNMWSSPEPDYNEMSEREFSAYAAELEGLYNEAENVLEASCGVYGHPQTVFLRAEVRFDSGDIVMYRTIYGGKHIELTLFAYTETLNPAQLSRIQSVVDSVVLEGEPEEASAPAEPFLYTDEQTWVSFWVPAGWSKTELVGDAEVLKCGFVSGEPDTAIIYYGNSDLYEEVSELGEYSREEINMELITSVFTIEELQESFLLGAEDAALITYGDTPYMVGRVTKETPYGSMEGTVAICINKGYEHFFYFYTREQSVSSVHYRSFKHLLAGAAFPAPHRGVTAEGGGEEPMEDNGLMERFTPANLLLSIVVTIGVYSVPIAIYRYGIRRRPMSAKAAKWVVVLYGIAALLVMTILVSILGGGDGKVAGGALLMWSWANYWMLTKGNGGGTAEVPAPPPKGEPDGADAAGDGQEATARWDRRAGDTPLSEGGEPGADAPAGHSAGQPEILYCRKCGKKLTPDSLYCSRCGAEIHRKST